MTGIKGFVARVKEQYAALKKDEDGATMVEYGLMIALVAIVVAAGAYAVGVNTNLLFTNVATVMDDAATNAASTNPFSGGGGAGTGT